MPLYAVKYAICGFFAKYVIMFAYNRYPVICGI